MLAAFEPVLAAIVCTQNSTAPRAAGRGARRGGARHLRHRPGVRRPAARGRDRPGGDAGRGGRRVRRGDRLRRRAGHRLRGHRRRGPAPAQAARDARREPLDPPRSMCAGDAGAAGRRAVPHRRGDHRDDRHRRRSRRSGSGSAWRCCACVAAGMLRPAGRLRARLGGAGRRRSALGFVVTAMFFLGVGLRGAVGHGVLPRASRSTASRPSGRCSRSSGSDAARSSDRSAGVRRPLRLRAHVDPAHPGPAQARHRPPRAGGRRAVPLRGQGPLASSRWSCARSTPRRPTSTTPSTSSGTSTRRCATS